MRGYLAARYGRAFRLEQGLRGPQSHLTVSLRGIRLTPVKHCPRDATFAYLVVTAQQKKARSAWPCLAVGCEPMKRVTSNHMKLIRRDEKSRRMMASKKLPIARFLHLFLAGHENGGSHERTPGRIAIAAFAVEPGRLVPPHEETGEDVIAAVMAAFQKAKS